MIRFFTLMLLLISAVGSGQDTTKALKCKVEGLNIQSVNTGITIRFRCSRTLTPGTDPILIVQGVITPLSNLSAINPNDISSIHILKWAEATAIYGPDGVNGAIIIALKKKPRITIVVRDSVDNSPIPFATIIFRTSGQHKWSRQMADSSGKIEIARERFEKGYEITISSAGYHSVTRPWTPEKVSEPIEFRLGRMFGDWGPVFLAQSQCPVTLNCKIPGVYINGNNKVVKEELPAPSVLSVYPNPAPRNSFINVKIPGEAGEKVSLKLVNNLGVNFSYHQVENAKSTGTVKLQIPANIPAGVYYLVMEYANRTLAASGKVIIQ